MSKSLVTEEQLQWRDLCKWIETNIYNYNDYQFLMHKALLILKGLHYGQAVANNNIPKKYSYPSNVVLMAFKANKIKILNAIKNKQFKDEAQQMSYICAIIKPDLQMIYERYNKALEVRNGQEKTNIKKQT